MPTKITPLVASTQTVATVTGTTPIYRDILISNVTISAASGNIAGIIWPRAELPSSNIVLSHVTLSASKTFEIYNSAGFQILDSQFNLGSGAKTFTLYNTDLTVSNSAAAAKTISFDGLAAANSLALYNASATMSSSNLLGITPLPLSGSTLTNTAGWTQLSNSTVVNFIVGTNQSLLAASTNLALNGTLNILPGDGFAVGANLLFTYGNTLTGSATLGSQPTGYRCQLDSSLAGQINLVTWLRPAVSAWGYDVSGECDVDPSLTTAAAVAAGAYYTLALRADGTLTAWGDNGSGQCNPPAEATNVVAIAAGAYHCLALRADGRVLAWGDNSSGQTNVPAGATNIVAISAGDWHNLALRADGTVIGWGDNSWDETTIPSGATNIVAIAAGGQHSLALKADGTVVGWGSDYGPSGDCTRQATVPTGLKGVVAIAAGECHSLALKQDGAATGWGDNSEDQAAVPTAGTNLVAIAAGAYHSLALQADGNVLAWGYDVDGECNVSSDLSGVTAIAAGAYHSLTLSGAAPAALRLGTATHTGKTFALALPTTRGKAYFLQAKTSLGDQAWSFVGGLVGDGGTKVLTDPAATAHYRFYRVRRQ